MTDKEAYFHGFCKAAADAGIDPEALAMMKEAAPAAIPASLTGSWLGDVAGRWVSRLLGSPAIRGPNLRKIKQLKEALGPLQQNYDRMSKIHGTSSATLQNMARDIASYQSQIRKLKKPIAAEGKKVLATRLATGAGVLGGVGLYQNAQSDHEKDSWY